MIRHGLILVAVIDGAAGPYRPARPGRPGQEHFANSLASAFTSDATCLTAACGTSSAYAGNRPSIP